MAEGLLKQALVGANRTDCQVSSAGLGALIGHQADASACQLMTRKGIDISGHHFEKRRKTTGDHLRH